MSTRPQPQHPSPTDVSPVVKRQAVAYYRHSAEDEQEDSIPVQRERIREWADDHDVEIVRESVDGQSLSENSLDE